MKQYAQKYLALNAAIGLGVISLGIQVVFIRLLLEVLQGNELFIGLALGIWLMGTSSGSILSSRLSQKQAVPNRIVFYVVPIFLLNYMLIKICPKLFHFIPGAPLPIASATLIILISLLPSSFICGALFPYLVKIIIKPGVLLPKQIARIYIYESIGSFLAAVMLNYFLFRYLSGFQALAICFLLFMICWSLPAFFNRKTRLPDKIGILAYLFIILLLIVAGTWGITRLNRIIYSPYQITRDHDTPYGNFKVMESGDQQVAYYQGKILYSTPDLQTVENRILIPLLNHPHPENVLIIGGNLAGYLPYLSKISSLKSVHYVEMDPALVRFQKEEITRQNPGNDLTLTFITSECRNYLSVSAHRYDIICLNEPEPSTLGLNRLYSETFFKLIRRHLKASGLYYFSIRSSENYINENLAIYIGILKNTLQREFAHVVILPGDENNFLCGSGASFGEFLSMWKERLAEYEIMPKYLTPTFMKYQLSEERMRAFEAQINRWQSTRHISDFNLNGYLAYFMTWSSLSGQKLTAVFKKLNESKILLVVSVCLALLAFRLFVMRVPSWLSLFNLFLVGAALIMLEVVLLYSYQVLFGTVYSGISIIFGLYLLGLAFGAGISTRQIIQAGARRLRITLLGMIAGCLILYLTGAFEWQIISSATVYNASRWMLYPSLIFFFGSMGGMYFAQVTSQYYTLHPSGNAGLTYGLDLGGAVLGALFSSVLLIPLMGIPGSLIFIGGILLLAMI